MARAGDGQGKGLAVWGPAGMEVPRAGGLGSLLSEQAFLLESFKGGGIGD